MSQPLPKVIVRRARDIIADKKNWCINMTSQTKTGRCISYASPQAEKFCAVGAIYRAAFEAVGTQDHHSLAATIETQVEQFSSQWLPGVNDKKGHKAVLKIFDSYLEKADA